MAETREEMIKEIIKREEASKAKATVESATEALKKFTKPTNK